VDGHQVKYAFLRDSGKRRSRNSSKDFRFSSRQLLPGPYFAQITPEFNKSGVLFFFFFFLALHPGEYLIDLSSARTLASGSIAASPGVLEYDEYDPRSSN
jgi:hypothetical protein